MPQGITDKPAGKAKPATGASACRGCYGYLHLGLCVTCDELPQNCRCRPWATTEP